MNDLQQLQIKQSCKLALPNGLQELMSDISREVLRSHPKDLCNFIAEYLAALLEARDKLTIAAEICDEVCHSSCQPELEDELRDIGLNDEEIKRVGNLVQKYFEKGQGVKVRETTLLIQLSKIIDVDESVLETILDAVRVAFRHHFINNAVKHETYSSDNDMDDRATKAAKNTVKFYENEMFKTCDPETEEPTEFRREKKEVGGIKEKRDDEKSLVSVSSMSLAGSYTNLPKHQPYVATQCCQTYSPNVSPEKKQTNIENTEETKQHTHEKKEVQRTIKKREKENSMLSLSSMSLAGSYINLPTHKPYVATQCCPNLSTLEESPEKEQMSLDYTVVTNSKKKVPEDKKRHSEVEIEPVASSSNKVTDAVKQKSSLTKK